MSTRFRLARGDGGDGVDGRYNDSDNASRYDRSRYVSSSRDAETDETPKKRTSRRRSKAEEASDSEREPYYDNFFEGMRIEEEPSSGSDSRASRNSKQKRSSHASSGDAVTAGSRPRNFINSGSRDTADDVRNRASRSRGSASSARDGEVSEKRPKGRRAGLVAIAVVIAVVLVGAGAAFAYMNSISSNLHQGVDQELRDVLVQTDMAKQPFYMLLLGTDGSAARDEDPELAGTYRSDSMMLARIDAPNKKVSLISINRDTLVDFGPEYGEQKINAAYSIGGPALAVQTVSQLAGVNISHYAQVDFDAFSALVDALGGVEVEVPIDIDDWEAGGAVNAGLQTLNGEQALILCRSRNAYAYTAAHPDEMRAANQRLVISAIAKKLLSSDIATIASSVQALSQYVVTDLNLTDIIGLAQAMQGLNPETDIYTAMAPTTSEYIDDVWVEILNQEGWREMMARVNAGEPPVEETVIDEVTGTVIATAGGSSSADAAAKYSAIMVKNGSDIQGLAAKMRTKLMDAGYKTVIIGDIAEGYEYPVSLVVYNDPSDEPEAEQIAQVIGQGAPFLNDGSYLLVDTDYMVIIGEDWVE